MVKTEAISTLIQESLELLEGSPVGGIGAFGPSQKELDAAIEQGHPAGMDDSFHRGQQLWLNLIAIQNALQK